ncbi:MAG: methylmalonyl Co-A mutase-associated GTPase MeaB [Bacteroidota bacterium]|nr:methylmalonyl Co-A mutase-associated GTPase MeaB [Bacteroidota bacterium]
MSEGNDKTKPTLIVNEGIEQPHTLNTESINQYRKKKIVRLNEPDYYIDGILAGDITILSKAITLIESSLSKHRETGQKVIDGCIGHSGNSLRIGITGVPGVGKSSFIETFGTYLTKNGNKVAVLAIDPSSQISGGSILGDKTRMEELSRNEMAFIRPSPSAGSLGGVARKTRETIILCEAAGFNIIIIETVGVGQSEIAVHSMVDFFLLLMLAGAGDELQGIKRGIMEMADMIAINKADGENIHKAKMAKVEYSNALHLYAPSESGWFPKVVTCSARTSAGLSDIWKLIKDFETLTRQNKFFELRRREQAKYWMYETLIESLKSEFFNDEKIKVLLPNFEKMVTNNNLSSFKAAAELIKVYKGE